ncbi:nuclear transport factor 2 family protein [Amycolatopsis jejuensis]|uniref:nuclear transport factor 2 family protein n=1 Tax=Amycolatopsis jejuensis TaxID=330084 RepID=UPI000524EF88|nr:nuclear transport factor 2 family protein [Amycolatopsis jejuensis]
MSLARDLQASAWDAECRHDLDGLLSHFLPDATFHASGQPANQGHAAIRRLTEDFYRSFPELEVDILGEWGDGDTRAVIEFRARLKDPQGNRFALQGVNVVEIEDGKFKTVRSYEEAPMPD